MTDNRDTEMVPGGDRFPATPWSAILRAGAFDSTEKRAALERLLTLYWRPIYAYIRRKWNRGNEDAKDLTQAFATAMIEKGLFAAADKGRGRFRALLRTSLENFLRNQHAETQAKSRGGGKKIVSLELAMQAEGEVPVREDLPAEDLFRLEWVRTIFNAAVDRLRRDYEDEGKPLYRRIFERYQLSSEEGLSYESVAKEFGVNVWDVTNYLADARRRLRESVMGRVREYCSSDEEFREELDELLGEA